MSLARVLEEQLRLPVKLRAGAPGSFRVLLDGQPIYTKPRAEHTPDRTEILRLLREKTLT